MKLAALFVTLLAAGTVAANANPTVERMFQTANAAAQSGQYDVAITTYRHLLREVPTPRIKLELARLLLQTGENSEALALFREVQDAKDTPQAVRRNILPFMEAAELRTVRIRYGIRAISESNPSRVSDGATVFFNGVPYEYQPEEEVKTSFGLEPWLSVERLWQNNLLTKLYSSARIFDNDQLNSGRFQFAVARQAESVPGLFVQVASDVEVRRHNSYVMPSLETWKHHKLTDTLNVGVGGQLGYMAVKDSDATGVYYRPYGYVDWSITRSLRGFGRVSLEHLNGRNDYYTYVAPKVEVGLNFRSAGFDITPMISLTQTRYSEYDPFWGVTRRDDTYRASVSVSHDQFNFKGFTPELTVFHEQRDSNVAIYEYHQTGAFVSLKRAY